MLDQKLIVEGKDPDNPDKNPFESDNDMDLNETYFNNTYENQVSAVNSIKSNYEFRKKTVKRKNTQQDYNDITTPNKHQALEETGTQNDSQTQHDNTHNQPKIQNLKRPRRNSASSKTLAASITFQRPYTPKIPPIVLKQKKNGVNSARRQEN